MKLVTRLNSGERFLSFGIIRGWANNSQRWNTGNSFGEKQFMCPYSKLAQILYPGYRK